MALVQLSLHPETYPVAVTAESLDLLAKDPVVAIGVSGGKDSSAVAVRTVQFLKAIGHRGPVVLIHSDLGRVEWRDSLPSCRRLADKLDLELIVVRRKSGDMLDRWRQRWRDNVERYASLECVQLILPWSTPSMRFCTSELKVQVICQELVKRFPGQVILSVSGIRREESRKRAAAPILRPQPLLFRAKSNTIGYDWHVILDWTLSQVLAFLQKEGILLHEAYTIYNSSRVSCCFCILSSSRDLVASSTCEHNQPIYRDLVELELESTFSFQDGQWLADIAPHLLTLEAIARIPAAKEAARKRIAAEAQIPRRLLYTKGWPTCVPTFAEAQQLTEVRKQVAAAVNLVVEYTDPLAIIDRYERLMEESKEARDLRDCPTLEFDPSPQVQLFPQ